MRRASSSPRRVRSRLPTSKSKCCPIGSSRSRHRSPRYRCTWSYRVTRILHEIEEKGGKICTRTFQFSCENFRTNFPNFLRKFSYEHRRVIQITRLAGLMTPMLIIRSHRRGLNRFRSIVSQWENNSSATCDVTQTNLFHCVLIGTENKTEIAKRLTNRREDIYSSLSSEHVLVSSSSFDEHDDDSSRISFDFSNSSSLHNEENSMEKLFTKSLEILN